MSEELGELLTRWSVRAAVACYAGAVASQMLRHTDGRSLGGRLPRWLRTIGLLFFWLHVLCAFQFFHHWSHAHAYAETARRTADVVGISWGGGLYFNYLFTAVWTFDVVASWISAPTGVTTNRWYRWILHAFLAFMFFNATIVFGPPFWKWIGVPVIALVLVWRLLPSREARPAGR